MPSMIESVVMRKCNVSYKQSKQIVAMARDFLRLPEDSNLLWSKELENACILVYNSTSCEDAVGVTGEKRVATTKPSLQKTKSSSNMKRDLLERPVTKERKARSLSKSRSRKTPKSPTVNSECTDLQGSSRSRESLATSSAQRQSLSHGRRVDEVSKNDALIKSARNLQRIGDSNDVRSSRPQRNISEISFSSRTSDRSFSSKSPSSSASQRSKSRSVRDMDSSYPDLNRKDVSKTTSASRRPSAECMDKQKKRPSSSQSSTAPEVLRRPRSSSEESSEREKYSRKGSRKSLSTSTHGDIPKTELTVSHRTTSQERRPQRSSEAADTNLNSNQRYSSPESPSSRSARPENFSVAIDKSGHSISRARGPDSKRSSLTMNPKSNHSTTETKAKTKRVDDSEENWARSRSVSSAKSHSKGRPAESKFFGSDDDDDSSCDSFACASKPSIVRTLQPKESKGSNASSPVPRRPRSPGPRIGANSECNKTKLMPLSHDRSNHSIRLEKSMRHEADERPRKEERKVHRISVSPTREQRAAKKDRTTPVSPISSVRLPSTSNSSVPSNKISTKKSAVSRRRLSMEEVAKACEADPALRDAIVSNFGKDSGGIRLVSYRAAPRVAEHGDEFTKSFEEWSAHNDDSSESTNASSKSPALQQYSMDNPLSKFIGKISNKSNSNKDENTVSTGSESSTKSKTRMIPVMKSTMSPPKKTIPNGGATEPSSVKPKGIVKHPSNLTIMSTDFADPFIAKKKDTSKSRRLVGSSLDTAPKASKVAGCSIGESVLSRTSNTTESTFSSSKDDSEEDIPMVDYAVPSFHDEYSEDQIFPEFSERFAKGHHGLTRKDSMRISSRADHGAPSSFRGKSSSPLASTKKSLSSRSSSLGPPKLPQRQRSMIRGS